MGGYAQNWNPGLHERTVLHIEETVTEEIAFGLSSQIS